MRIQMLEAGMVAIELDLEAHKLIEAARNNLEEKQLDIIKRVLKGAATPKPMNGKRCSSPERERRTGSYLVRLADREEFARSQKDAYIKLLTWLSRRSPLLLDKLAQEQTRRGRRLVARTRSELYPRPGLDHYAEEIVDGWWADLNLSKVQKQQRLKLACRLAGVAYGFDKEAYADL